MSEQRPLTAFDRQPTSFRLTPTTTARLARLAARLDLSRAGVIAAALAELEGRLDTMPPLDEAGVRARHAALPEVSE